ncbi:Helicase SEN1 [Gracilariopsis chorda]|uniref:Helicase SEN1 n=1 Tax=Gracilariopsis chorda TaxID=448386 RepID=A0A2V3IZQ9_9FLOR|nr:Helicase SEN1 [Gracilariopsis chorda]|eukprot:PXF47631.1 Helicase SEN1 [Gracilariopsis chorda]
MQAVTTTPQTRSLAQIVCEWQPSQLSETTARFSENSSAPQTTFPTYHSYKAYFEPLLFAELSAELLSAIEKYHRAPTSRQSKIRARREESGTTVAIVTVQKVIKSHPPGFGWTVDVETCDRRGPIGCVDNDIVAVWSQPATENSQHNRSASSTRKIPSSAVLSLIKSINRTGCRLITSRFPEDHENNLLATDPEHSNKQSSKTRRWNILRVGSITTVKREFDALQTIKNSVLLPVILRPRLQQSTSTDGGSENGSNGARKQVNDADASSFASEHFFTNVVVEKTGLNPSQARAIIHSSTTRSGFSVIQGPPGTGKTRTLIGLLNVVHMTQYQKYYEGLLASLESLHGSVKQKQTAAKAASSDRAEEKKNDTDKSTEGSLLETMMDDMSKTISVATDINTLAFPKHIRRPRLLICAPSNSAVDEVLTRLVRSKFVDGQGRQYCPELARIGAGDRVSDAAKPLTAEGQAERFLDRVCGEEMNPEAREKAQRKSLTSWQNRCNTLLVQLSRTPKDQESSQSVIIQLHENLERLDRDMRRLRIAVADGKKGLTREDKLRMIARTYVEDAQLVFATLSGSASSILTRSTSSDFFDDGQTALFDTVVIDEAAQATETSCLVPLTLGASRCLLVGDPQQLPATVLSSGSAGLAYGQSLLERVCRAGQAVLLLDTQYRMHPAISSFPRRYFYNGRLVDDHSVQDENRARPYHRHSLRPKFGPYVFLDISEGREKRTRDDKSVFNPAEAELAALIYTKLKKEFPQDPLFSAAAKTPGSVSGFGVVTPYKRQMQELRQSFDRAGIPTGDVEIDTVDSYQGREKEFVVFSCVRTVSLNRGIGFVRDVRRMNVGLTRARASLIILGSAQALAEGSQDWAELIEDANSRGCLLSVTNIARCLEPAPPHEDPHVQCKKQGNRKGKSPAQNQIPRKVETVQDRGNTNRKPNSGPTDPRKRLQRRDRKEPPKVPTPQAGADVVTAKTEKNAQQNVQATHEVEQQHGMLQVHANQPEITQMTKVLSDAGFENVKAVEATLADHVNRGGNLDIETVMAAAIASNGSHPIEPLAETKKNAEDESKSGKPSRMNSTPDPQVETVVGDSTKGDGTDQHFTEQKASRPSNEDLTFKNDFLRPDHREIKGTPAKISRADKRPKKAKYKEVPKESATPSGWDLLFSQNKGNTENPAVKKEVEIKNDANIAANQSTSASSKEKSLIPQVPPVEKKDVASDTHPKEQYQSMDSSFRGNEGEWGTHVGRRDSLPYSHRGPRPWIDRGRGKRPRGHDFHESRSRGYERARSRQKRGRPDRHHDHFHSDHASAAYGPSSSWSNSAPYGSNVAGGYPMMGMMDPSMAVAPPGLLPLQPVQPQAIQQQLYQQQMIQQQALQQQVLQQQAIQHQALQQQAAQQEALRQQSVLMQISAAGMNPNTISPSVYPVSDFNGYVGGMTGGELHGGMNQEQWARESWGTGKTNQNGYGGRSRGRGRFRGHRRGRWR